MGLRLTQENASRAAIVLATILSFQAAESASAQQQGYICGKMGLNIPNRCRYTVGAGQKEGWSSCSLDTSDPTVGWYTDCAGGTPQKVQIIGGLYACCAVDATCPGKPKPAYVAACSTPASRSLRKSPAMPGLLDQGSPFGIGIGVGVGVGNAKRPPDKYKQQENP